MSRLDRLPRDHPDAWKDEPSPSLREALRLARAARPGPPTEADVPPPSVFPGVKEKRLAGQLAIGEER